MKSCMKTLRKIPMAMIGAIDFSVCTTVWAVNQLAKRGEKVIDCMTEHDKAACPERCACAPSNDE